MKPHPSGMSIAEVARRCDVSHETARAWPAGIRVGGTIVRLECEVVGTRCRVTEEQLAKFKADCHEAKFGRPPEVPPPTPAQEARRAAESRKRAIEMCRS